MESLLKTVEYALEHKQVQPIIVEKYLDIQ
jgi:hypothetical protein